MTCPLTVAATEGIISQGGSILGSSRTNPYRNPDSDLAALRENFRAIGVGSLIVIGGDDTLGVASDSTMISAPRRRHSQDDRQRPDGDRLFIWVRHGRQHRDRSRRSAADHGRKPSADHGRRDYGTALGLDRLLRRHRGRGRLHPRARSADRLAALDRGLAKRRPQARNTASSSLPKGPSSPNKAPLTLGR